jgi:hypothetical protein
MVGRQVDNAVDSYPAKLAKLIPAEVSAAYLAINSFVPASEGFSPIMVASLLVLTVFCALYLWKIQNVNNAMQIAFTTASFPIWALNISSSRSDSINPIALGVILILVTVAIPLVPTSKDT